MIVQLTSIHCFCLRCSADLSSWINSIQGLKVPKWSMSCRASNAHTVVTSVEPCYAFYKWIDFVHLFPRANKDGISFLFALDIWFLAVQYSAPGRLWCNVVMTVRISVQYERRMLHSCRFLHDVRLCCITNNTSLFACYSSIRQTALRVGCVSSLIL